MLVCVLIFLFSVFLDSCGVRDIVIALLSNSSSKEL